MLPKKKSPRVTSLPTRQLARTRGKQAPISDLSEKKSDAKTNLLPAGEVKENIEEVDLLIPHPPDDINKNMGNVTFAAVSVGEKVATDEEDNVDSDLEFSPKPCQPGTKTTGLSDDDDYSD